MNNHRILLEFEGVSVPEVPPHAGALDNVTFTLSTGDIALIRVDDTCDHLPLADAAEGLVTPAAGTVRLDGEDWASMGSTREAEMRGRIRRIFDGEGWISNLDLIENVILAECHHTPRPRADLVAEAEAHTRAVGLPGIPAGRPVGHHIGMLRKLEFARALMGRPDLIIIDRYNLLIPRTDLGRIIEAIRAAAGRHTAVLWQTCEQQVWEHPDLQTVFRFTMDGTRMVPEKRAGG